MERHKRKLKLARAIRTVLARRDLSSSTKLAFLLLATKDGEPVSIARGAEEIGVGARTWASALQSLRAANLIRSARDGFGEPSRHTVVLEDDDGDD